MSKEDNEESGRNTGSPAEQATATTESQLDGDTIVQITENGQAAISKDWTIADSDREKSLWDGVSLLETDSFYDLNQIHTREPRTKWQDIKTLLHLPRAMFVYIWVIIGAFLSPEIHISRLLLSFVLMFSLVQLVAYRLDELIGRHCATTTISDQEHWYTIYAGFTIATITATYMVATTHWSLLIPLFVGFFFALAYNFEIWGGMFHNTWWFAFSWAFAPLVSSFYYQHLEIPSLSLLIPVLLIGIYSMYIAKMHIRSYGLTKCYSSHVCKEYQAHVKECALFFEDKNPHPHMRICHGMPCIDRLTMSKPVRRLGWKIINDQFRQVIFLGAFILTLGLYNSDVVW